MNELQKRINRLSECLQRLDSAINKDALIRRLTAPHRLQELLEWEESNSPLNPAAQELVTMAIAQAKSETAGQ